MFVVYHYQDSLTVEPRSPVLLANTLIFNNTSKPLNTKKPREQMLNFGNNLDEELLSLLTYKTQSLAHSMKEITP